MALQVVQPNRRTFLKLSAATILSTAGLSILLRHFFLSEEDLVSLSEVALSSELTFDERVGAAKAYLLWRKNTPTRLTHSDWRDMQSLKLHALLVYRRSFSGLSQDAKRKVIKRSLARAKGHPHLVLRFAHQYFHSTAGINLIHRYRVDAFCSRSLEASRDFPEKLS